MGGDEILIHTAILFLLTAAGVTISCKVFAYQISVIRKLGAALVFALLNQLSIPVLGALLPLIAMYLLLFDNRYDRTSVNKVFMLTLVFSAVGIIATYRLGR